MSVYACIHVRMCAYMCMCECDNLIIHMPVEPAPSGRLVDCVGRLEAPARHAPAHTRAHICANEHRTRTPRKRTRERTFFGLVSGASTPNTCPPCKIPTKEPPQASTPSHIRQPTSAFVSALALTRAISDVAAPGRACPCRRRCGGCSRTGAGPRRDSWGRGPTETT